MVMMKYAHDYLQAGHLEVATSTQVKKRALAAAGARTDQVKVGPVGVPIACCKHTTSCLG